MRRATLIAAMWGDSSPTSSSSSVCGKSWRQLHQRHVDRLHRWFLENAARGQVQQLALHDILAGHKVSQAMNRQYTAILATLLCNTW